MAYPEIFKWHTNTFPTSERYDAWADALNQTWGSWDIRPSENRDYSASLATTKIGSLYITDCHCAPCSADRKPVNISKDNEEKLLIQLTLDGIEHMMFNNDEYVLEKGDITIWDNTQRMNFQVCKSSKDLAQNI